MILSDIERTIDAITQEKNLPRDVVVKIIEDAVVAAARKVYGANRDLEAQYDDDAGDVAVYEYRVVVEGEVENADLEITLEEARALDPESLVGDSIGLLTDLATAEMGRIPAEAAKQVIHQKLRDAERERTFSEFQDRKGELITGIVRRFDRGDIIVDLNRAEAILPRREQVITESYRPGDRIEAYITDIDKAARRPQVVLSRAHPNLLVKLFEREVPEIYEGIVRIEGVAREPGQRAKIAVSSTDPDVDPVGACVGLKGSRVQAVGNEVRGEAVDIIAWHPEPAHFVIQAIHPAHVSRVYFDEHTRTMELIVPDDQLARAIGRRGQNVRLASELVQWKIDITPESRYDAQIASARAELARIPSTSEADVDALLRSGFLSAQEVADTDAAELARLLDVEESEATRLVEAADQLVETLIMEEAQRRRSGLADEPPEL